MENAVLYLGMERVSLNLDYKKFCIRNTKFSITKTPFRIKEDYILIPNCLSFVDKEEKIAFYKEYRSDRDKEFKRCKQRLYRILGGISIIKTNLIEVKSPKVYSLLWENKKNRRRLLEIIININDLFIKVNLLNRKIPVLFNNSFYKDKGKTFLLLPFLYKVIIENRKNKVEHLCYKVILAYKNSIIELYIDKLKKRLLCALHFHTKEKYKRLEKDVCFYKNSKLYCLYRIRFREVKEE